MSGFLLVVDSRAHGCIPLFYLMRQKGNGTLFKSGCDCGTMHRKGHIIFYPLIRYRRGCPI